MIVSVIVGLLNEEKYLPKLIEDFKNQTYPKEKIELIFIDGMSDDKSFDILEKFKKSDKEFKKILLLKNPKKILSAGMNIGIKKATGEAFLKVDCHSHITKDFIYQNVKTIESGEKVCGGPRPNIIENDDSFSKTLLLVEENVFGSGIANYRKKSDNNKIKYVKSVFQGMYKREVFERVGLLDEKVGRVEDNELHYRIRKHGYKIAYNNNILSYQYTRPNFKKMLKQKFSNGLWIGRVSHIYPKCFSIFHFAPFCFVLALILTLFLTVFTYLPIIILLLCYFIPIIFLSIYTILKNENNKYNFLLPLLIFLVHISYGFGSIEGLMQGFKWKKIYLKEKNIEYLN